MKTVSRSHGKTNDSDSTDAAGATSASADAQARKDAGPSSRYAIRFESSVTRLASASEAADRASFDVFDLSAGVLLEHVIQSYEFGVPEGDEPYRFATIAGSVAKSDAAAQRSRSTAASDDASTDGEVPTDTSGTGTAESTHGAGRHCTCLAVIPKTSTSLMIYDASFARRVQPKRIELAPDGSGADTDSGDADLPGFPGFSLKTDFFSWIQDNVDTEDIAEMSAIFGTSTIRTLRRLTNAMTVVHGLPQFADRVRRGEFTQAHVDVAANLCQTVAMRFLPVLDDYLARRRADVTSDTMRTALRKMIQSLVPSKDRAETMASRRCVEIDTFKNGTACMQIRGPAAEVNASYDRIRAMARAVAAGNSNTFNLSPGVEIIDDRGIQALMYDIVTRPQPKLSIKVREIDPVTGIARTRESSLIDDNGDLLFSADEHGVSGLLGGLQPPADPLAGTAFRAAPAASVTAEPVEYYMTVSMPTEAWWLANQAGTVVTVPYLTLIGESDLPGVLADGSPVPAETARRIASRSKTLTRILTDPATGTPIDAKATTYRIPSNVRKTLIAQWASCSVPGCTRPAAKSEIDHVDPFFHLDPLKGGLTRFGNLHPLCAAHHAVKTARKYAVRMPETGVVEYEFPHGINATARAPDQPVDATHALEFDALTRVGIGRTRIPQSKIPPPPLVLELMPGEKAIRERNEANRIRRERLTRQKRLQDSFDEGNRVRRRQMIDRSRNWEGATFQLCLPPGADPRAIKQLPRGQRRTCAHERRRQQEQQQRRRQQQRQMPDPWAAEFEHVRSDKSENVPRVKWDHDVKDDPPPF